MKESRFPLDIRSFIIILAAAIVLALPMLVYGPLPQGHDTYEQLNYVRHFREQFWRGDWYPRWLAGMNHGLGSPTFFVYPPLPSYVNALLEPAAKVFRLDAFRMGELLALSASGICAFLWLDQMAGRRAALAAAVLYMLMPYHLAVDYYRRTAVSECWGLVWIPLVLYFSARAMRGERVLVGLAVAYALLILSHLVSVLIFSWIPLLGAAMIAPRGDRLRSALRIAAGMLLGAGLSCFYLVPALYHARNFPVSRLPLWSELGVNLITADAILGRDPTGFVRTISLSVLDAIALCAFCGAFVLLAGREDSRKKIQFGLAVCVIPVLLMFNLSLPVWRAFPLLFAAIQFPWRFNIVLCLGTVAIVAVFLPEVASVARWPRALALFVTLVLLLPWLWAYRGIWKHYEQETAMAANDAALLSGRVNEHDGWFAAWSPPGMDQASALKASLGPPARFLSGEGTVTPVLWKPRQIEFETNSTTGGRIMINQFFYPAWTAALLNPPRALEIKASTPEGLLEVQVPAGSQRIQLTIPTGISEHTGRWISIASAMLLGLLAWRAKTHAGFASARRRKTVPEAA